MNLSRRRLSRILTLLLLLYGVLIASRLLDPVDPSVSQEPPDDSWYSVYFTNPGSASASTLRGGPDERLASAIDAAVESVEVAAYQLNLWSIRDALLRAHQRGVAVRLVTETDNLDEEEVLELQLAGVSIRSDQRGALMHHKFVVIDSREVWTGSMNLTVNGAYRNNNNLIRLNAPWIADQYLEEFAEMFTEDRFGALSLAGFPYPARAIGDSKAEVLFSPDDQVAGRIVELLGGAQNSIHIMAYNLTFDQITEVVLERAAAGVAVYAVFDEGQANNQGSDVARLREAGLDVVLDGNPRKMHHKVIVVDGELVITGSYNFSLSAEERNDENVLILFSTEIAALYLAEFEQLSVEANY
jgi:phosphatidylserine/phosphatidylglycerophosphate/cardiolipin synthase-like enzyme